MLLFLLLTLKTPLYIFRADLYRKTLQLLWNQWLSLLLLLPFSETDHENQKNFIMSRKLGTSPNKMVYPEGISFLWWGLFTPSFKPIACVVDKQRDVYRNTFCYKDYVCQVSKIQHMYEIGLILLSVLETTKQTRLYQI